uniref:Uncharacterized protein n=1 Tax=Sus scrofa TaxID=9823 RepID=A0A4X1UJF6_PIG
MTTLDDKLLGRSCSTITAAVRMRTATMRTRKGAGCPGCSSMPADAELAGEGISSTQYRKSLLPGTIV